MKIENRIRIFLGMFLIVAMLSPTAVLAFGEGKKQFKVGLKHSAAEEWDKAAEAFALAVADNPKNPEYKLHLVRAMFQASQLYMKRGALAANEGDFEGGYVAFRKAYNYDPTNELAKSEMERMVRLQEAKANPSTQLKPTGPAMKMVPTAYGSLNVPVGVQVPQKLEKLRDLPFPAGVDLMFIVKELARDLDLNVLFDQESFRTAGRKTNIDLKNVTAARALDYIFLQEGLFFQKVGPRTILVASQQQRTKFQQLVLRTFYLANAAPKDVAKVVQTAIPAQPGRSQTIVLTDDSTNSVTIRDTAENIKLIGQLIRSLDKDRAEVVMDVAIYEVNKNDLLQFGNQIGTANTLTNLGGGGVSMLSTGGSQGIIKQGLEFLGLNLSSVALGLPASSIAALQSKNNTKLIASTQIHAFNNEDSSARIGQRVPVQSAQFVTGAGNTPSNGGVVSNVINYEQVGLTLKFKPLVFPNQDVQVAMEIESKDVAGASTLTPTFTERTIKGTARIQNNKTLLLASVAQGVETNGRTGLPLVGLIPIIGRLFTAPTKDNRQVDIVIAVTPRVIRAPAILPEDQIERETGSIAVPTTNTLEALVLDEEQQDMLAAAKRMTLENETTAVANSTPTYVPNGAATPEPTRTAVVETPKNDVDATSLRPIDSTVKTLKLTETSLAEDGSPTTVATAGVSFGTVPDTLKAGEKAKIAIVVDGNTDFASAVVGLKYDPKKMAIRSITFGSAFGDTMLEKAALPFLNQGGKTRFSLNADDGVKTANGVLAFIEVEALVDGQPMISFDRDMLNLLTYDGKNIVAKVIE